MADKPMITGASRSHLEQTTGAVLWNLGKRGNKGFKLEAQWGGVLKNLMTQWFTEQLGSWTVLCVAAEKKYSFFNLHIFNQKYIFCYIVLDCTEFFCTSCQHTPYLPPFPE